MKKASKKRTTSWLEQGATSTKGVGRYTHGDNLISFLIGCLITLAIFLCLLFNSLHSKSMQEIETKKYEIEVLNASINVGTKKQLDYSTFKSIAEEGVEEARKKLEEDADFLARVIFWETGTIYYDKTIPYEERLLCQQLAGSAVINATDYHIGGAQTMYETVYCTGRYAQSTLERVSTSPAPQEFVEIARDLLKNGSVGPKNLIYQAQFKQGIEYCHIGNQYFGCEPSLL